MGDFTCIFDQDDLAILDCILKQHHCVRLCYLDLQHLITLVELSQEFKSLALRINQDRIMGLR
jgi:hypothetical protein